MWGWLSRCADLGSDIFSGEAEIIHKATGAFEFTDQCMEKRRDYKSA